MKKRGENTGGKDETVDRIISTRKSKGQARLAALSQEKIKSIQKRLPRGYI